MADNTTLPVGAGGDTIRTVDRTTSKTQVVGLDIGGEPGPESLVTPANPLPVVGVVQLSPDGLGVNMMDAALPVTLAIDQPPIAVTQTQLGQQLMQQSVPVTLAMDQTSVVVTANQGVSPFNIAGPVSVTNFPVTQPVSGTVAVSNLPATQAVSVASLPLPANAAQETSGNLATLVTLTQQMQQLIELNKMSLAALRANNLLLASLGGASVNPGDLLDDVTFQ